MSVQQAPMLEKLLTIIRSEEDRCTIEVVRFPEILYDFSQIVISAGDFAVVECDNAFAVRRERFSPIDPDR